MSCHNSIPEYLHWNNQIVYNTIDFLDDQKLYRLGNPIGFPQTYTAYSCKWSFLIKEEDVLYSNYPPISDDYRYVTINTIRKYSSKRENINDDIFRWHKLTCVIIHSPEICDYSHSEILIRHQAWSDENEQEITFDQTYTYQDWQQGNTLLQGKSFYKILRKDYRRDIIQLFCNK